MVSDNMRFIMSCKTIPTKKCIGFRNDSCDGNRFEPSLRSENGFFDYCTSCVKKAESLRMAIATGYEKPSQDVADFIDNYRLINDPLINESLRCDICKKLHEKRTELVYRDHIVKEKQKFNDKKVCKPCYWEHLFHLGQDGLNIFKRRVKDLITNLSNKKLARKDFPSIDELIELYRTQKGRCHLSNIHFPDHWKHPLFKLVMIRLDPSGDWSIDNVRFVARCFNTKNPSWFDKDPLHDNKTYVEQMNDRISIRDLQLETSNKYDTKFDHTIQTQLRQRNITDTTSLMDIYRIIDDQFGRCALTGIPLVYQTNHGYTPIIDRKDLDRPYENDNIRIVIKLLSSFQTAFIFYNARGDRLVKTLPTRWSDKDFFKCFNIKAWKDTNDDDQFSNAYEDVKGDKRKYYPHKIVKGHDNKFIQKKTKPKQIRNYVKEQKEERKEQRRLWRIDEQKKRKRDEEECKRVNDKIRKKTHYDSLGMVIDIKDIDMMRPRKHVEYPSSDEESISSFDES